MTTVRVVTSAQAAARDHATIAAGTPSRALMQRAGAAAAAEIALRMHADLGRGALVFAGPGNNGGDAWVVARALHASGVRVRVCEPVEARTDDARFERTLALRALGEGALVREWRGEGVVIDGLLGTGAAGAPRDAIAACIPDIASARDSGARVAALDLPTGIDATNGDTGSSVRADLTVTFGTIKRGHLLARGACGTIVVLDIGLLPDDALPDDAPALVTRGVVTAVVPPIRADAHKGTRGKLAIVGGAEGMAGAAILAARGALRSGVGMAKLAVARESVPAVQKAEPVALAATWPERDSDIETLVSWADALVIGPGLGRSAESRRILMALAARGTSPLVLDADALYHLADDHGLLREIAKRRPVLLTPHAVELARLAGTTAEEIRRDPFEAARAFATSSGAVVLLKGVPTVIAAPGGQRFVSARGTPALGTGGSGDVLSGIAGTLMAQGISPLEAGAAAAWVHGRAAERASRGRPVRGIDLDDVLAALHGAWPRDARASRYPVLVELPAVGEDA